jgi:hypothetical protein
MASTVVLASGCLGGSSAAPSNAAPTLKSGTVSGWVVIDGGAAIADNGGVVDLRAVRAARLLITGRTVAGTRLVRRSTTGKDGRFRLRLPPGRYAVTAEIFPSAPIEPHRLVTVTAGHAVTVRITGHVH